MDKLAGTLIHDPFGTGISSRYLLGNGATVTVTYSTIYGEYVSAVLDKEAEWHACNGIHTLPARMEWVLEWNTPYLPEKQLNPRTNFGYLLRPNFKRINT